MHFFNYHDETSLNDKMRGAPFSTTLSKSIQNAKTWRQQKMLKVIIFSNVQFFPEVYQYNMKMFVIFYNQVIRYHIAQVDRSSFGEF